VLASWKVRALFAVCITVARPALAQSSDVVAAEALFQEGRALLESGDAAAACPKLSESYRLDPGTGTLLALGSCYEKSERFASAWASYTEAHARARRDGQTQREAFARERAESLRPRLSTLLIEVSPELAATPGLEILRDGGALGRGAWNVGIPIDGGEHTIDVRAPGKLPWSSSVTLRNESDAQRVAVPALSDAPAASPAPGAELAADASTRPDTSKPFGTLEWAGIATGGAGVIALGVGGYFLADALGKKSDSEEDCSGDACGLRGLELRSTAVERGNLATAFGVAGAVLAGAGATLFIVGRTRSPSGGTESGLVLAPAFGFQRAGGVTLHGRF
jgi:hypothetical protein